jgi:hypothetical protein
MYFRRLSQSSMSTESLKTWVISRKLVESLGNVQGCAYLGQW